MPYPRLPSRAAPSDGMTLQYPATTKTYCRFTATPAQLPSAKPEIERSIAHSQARRLVRHGQCRLFAAHNLLPRGDDQQWSIAHP